MVVLRADPWTPEFGMGFEASSEAAPLPPGDPFVETDDWSSARAPARPSPCPLWFVDGVRRAELRLIASDDGRTVPGLFGSLAVGSVRCEGAASFGEPHVDRAVVLGGGMGHEPVDVSVGSHRMWFRPASDPGVEPDRPLWRLQQLMREQEGLLASRLAAEEGCVVIVDGPLTFRDPTRAPVVGLVKRFARQYLAPEHDALVGRLEPGQRTPLFAVGDEAQPVQRFAWYTRLAAFEPPWHDHAGVVRCEVRAALGLAEAVAVADRVTSVLPSYAGRRGDPRTPQNVLPVAGLEARLRHRMGDRAMIRRALVVWLAAREG
jgi:hypothetical protein